MKELCPIQITLGTVFLSISLYASLEIFLLL